MSKLNKNIKKRMKILNISANQLAEMTFMNKTDIQAILSGKTDIHDIDEFDLALICSALHCTEEMLLNNSKQDLLSNPHKSDTPRSIQIKARMQDFLHDFACLSDVISEN